ncbi:MAG TPA: hypothetical protein VJA47_03890 [archaeon]|nr:hypothetical protein [archaeon]
MSAEENPKAFDGSDATGQEILLNIRDNMPLCNSITELSEKTGYTQSALRHHAEKFGLKLPTLSDNISKRIEENFGRALSKSHLAELARCSRIAVDNHLERMGLEISERKRRGGVVSPSKGNRKPNSLFNRMILEGATLKEMGEACGQTAESARQYIVKRGLYDLWRTSRAKRSRMEAYPRNAASHMHSEIARLVEAHFLEKLEAEPLHVRKAFEYFLSRKNTGNNIPVERLIQVLEKYYKAKEDGEVLSLREMGESAGISTMEVRRILFAIGEKPMHGSIENMTRFSEDEEEGIKRAFEMGMGAGDIGYFIGRSAAMINNKKCEFGLKGRSQIKQFGFGKTHECLAYRKASEIYLAKDLGYSKEEIMELLDVSERVYGYAMENQEEIEEKIENVLDILHSKRRHPRPYITSTEGEHLVRIDGESVIGFGSEEEASGYIDRIAALGISPERIGVYRKVDVEVSAGL